MIDSMSPPRTSWASRGGGLWLSKTTSPFIKHKTPIQGVDQSLDKALFFKELV